MDMQELIDTIGRASAMTRSGYHLTPAKALEALESAVGDTKVFFDATDTGPTGPHSYRGYYSDLAFESGAPPTVAEFKTTVNGTIGETYEGYKGGDFVMAGDTPLWSASYGCTGRAIVGIIIAPERVTLVTKDVD